MIKLLSRIVKFISVAMLGISMHLAWNLENQEVGKFILITDGMILGALIATVFIDTVMNKILEKNYD